jgi:hypothetical protein
MLASVLLAAVAAASSASAAVAQRSMVGALPSVIASGPVLLPALARRRWEQSGCRCACFVDT